MTERLQPRWWRGALLATCAASLAAAPIVMANTPQPPMEIGRLWHCPEYDGAEGFGAGVYAYPGGTDNVNQGVNPNYIKRQWLPQAQKTGTYMWSTDFTDPEGTNWPVASSYFFRSMNYNYPAKYISTDAANGNMNYLYAGGGQEYYRYPRPQVAVATDQGTQYAPFFVTPDSAVVLPDNDGTGHRPQPVIDNNLVTEQAEFMWWRYIMGVQLNRWEYVYGQGTPHQDYVLQDITLKNNGISGTSDDAPVMNAPVTGLVWAQAFDYRNNGTSNFGTGSPSVGMDNEATYVQPWGSDSHGAMMFWDTDSQDASRPGPDWGDPDETGDFDNLLVGNCYALYGAVFTSDGPGASYGTDDPNEPAYRTMWWERGFDYAGKPYSPAGPPPGTTSGMQTMRNDMTAGFLQLPYGELYTDFGPDAGISADGAGATGIMGFGKQNGDLTAGNSNSQGWTLDMGDSVRIVEVMAGGAIDKEEGRRIGTTWAAQKAASADPSTWMSADDIALVQTGADTAKKAANMAYWNYYGHFPTDVTADTLTKWGVPNFEMTKPSQYNQPYNVPDPPRAPGFIYVTGNGTNAIDVYWTTESETTPNHDTGVNDFQGYRIYRSTGDINQPLTMIASGPASDFAIANDVPGITNTRKFEDTSVSPGTAYWYAITAYDDGSSNWANTGVVQESSPWWTWTGFILTGVEPEYVSVKQQVRPDRFALAQNAPNPFNPTTSINYSLPTAGNVQLDVYDLNGRLVRSLVNGSVASGVHEVTWDGRDAVGRQVASGVYIYRLVAPNGQLTRRMTLVR